MTLDTAEPYKTARINPKRVAEGKAAQMLYQTDTLKVMVQTVSATGGETELHSHGDDAVWVVLEGEATFYGERERVIAILRPNDTLMIPHGAPYWFKNSGVEHLVILRFGARVPGVPDAREVREAPRADRKREMYT